MSTTIDVLDHYHRLEAGYRVSEDDTFGGLVVPNGNGGRAFHRWFRQKEAFSADLLPAVLARWSDGDGGTCFLDPFAGSGTSLLSASGFALDGRVLFERSYGVEANPFLHFVASTKVRARREGAPGLAAVAKQAIAATASNKIDPSPIPGLSTFSNSTYFRPNDLRQLLQLRAAIERANADPVSLAVARLCLAASIEPVSGLRRDGRALRYEAGKVRVSPLSQFREHVDQALEDLATGPGAADATVTLGDGRRVGNVLPPVERVSVALFSPPYLNNIDYTEVYKLEGWFLGYYGSQEAFRSQRLATLRSHPSVRFPDVYGASANGHSQEFDALLAPLLATIPDNRYKVWRGPLFRGYFDDMLETLTSLHGRMDEHGLVAFVVGNSLHGSGSNHFLVAADLMIARLAEMAGYEVIEIVIGRRPRRRDGGGDLLRESVVALRPRKGRGW